MSSRDELREALKSSLKANLHISYVIADGHCSHGITRWDKAMDAVLAVLDQQGWPQEAPSQAEVDAISGSAYTHLPDPSAAEPVPPVGTASLLGTPLADQLQERREDIAMAICRAECDPESDFGFHDDMDCSGKGADAVVGYLSVALREAARYAPLKVAYDALYEYHRSIVCRHAESVVTKRFDAYRAAADDLRRVTTAGDRS